MMDGYGRVSDVGGRDGERYISPTTQREAIEGAAARIGETLDELIIEEDVSGAKRAQERTLEYLIAKCERGESNGIIVPHIDRLSRGSLQETAAIYERLDKAGVRLISALEGMDSIEPGAELNFGVRAVMAREQWRRYQANWKTTRQRGIKRGAYPTRTPWGYDRDECGRLVPSEWAPIVRELFLRRARGATISELAQFLADVPPPSKSCATGSWSHSTIAQTLRNRVYLGEQRHGEFENEDAHPPIVSHGEFDAAQVAKPIRTPQGNPRSSEVLFTGIARCAGCGHTLKIVTGYGGRLRYYCKGPYSSGVCPARCLIRVDELDPYVEDWFLAAIGDEIRVARAVEANERLFRVDEEVDELEREHLAFVTTASVLDRRLFLAGEEARRQRVELKRLERAELRSQASLLGKVPAGDLLKLWPGLSIVEKRRLFVALADTVRVSRGNGPVDGRVQFVRVGVVVGPNEAGIPLA
ncbi:MAG: recombinase family protein [Gaiellaceae bacterium]